MAIGRPEGVDDVGIMPRRRSGGSARTPHREAIVVLVLSLGACSNDYSQFDFDMTPLEGGAEDATDDGASTGGTGGTGGSSGGGSGGGGAGSGGTGGTGGGTGGGGATGGAGGTTIPDAAPDSPTDGAAGPDATSPPIDSGLASCNSLYGGASMYVFCSEGPSSCTFAAATLGTCTMVCSTLGGTCLDADDNGTLPCVATTTVDTCATARQTAICTCSRG
jgi:hypothetical protein